MKTFKEKGAGWLMSCCAGSCCSKLHAALLGTFLMCRNGVAFVLSLVCDFYGLFAFLFISWYRSFQWAFHSYGNPVWNRSVLLQGACECCHGAISLFCIPCVFIRAWRGTSFPGRVSYPSSLRTPACFQRAQYNQREVQIFKMIKTHTPIHTLDRISIS